MSINAEKFKSYLDGKNIKYDYHEATEKTAEAIIVGTAGNNADEIRVIFFFDDDANSVNVKSFSVAKVPSNKLMDAYVKVNELNYEYRWVKFYIDDDNEITVSGDAIVDPDSAGEELFEMLARYMKIIDDVYPALMKVIWA